MSEGIRLSLINDLKKYFHINTISSGLIATIFGATGPILIIISGATAAGLTYTQTISWIFAVYFFGGLLGLILSLKYRQPISGAFSIAGAVLVVESLSTYTLNEAVGAYIIANLIILILGLTGLVKQVMKWIPVPIVMGMIVGILIHFAVNMVNAISLSPFIAGAAIVTFLLSMRLLKRFPPVLSALVVVIFLVYLSGEFQFSVDQMSFVRPEIVIPTFKFDAIIAISIPLALIIIATENAQAIGVLVSENYRPPISKMAIGGSLLGLIASLFGAHAINVAGPMTAICASKESGAKEGRYVASVVNGVLFAVFGLLAAVVVPLIIAMPQLVIIVASGLAMITVLLNSLKVAFSSQQFQMGAFFALVIGMSDLNFFGISAPLWAIIGSLIVSLIVEKEHFVKETSH